MIDLVYNMDLLFAMHIIYISRKKYMNDDLPYE